MDKTKLLGKIKSESMVEMCSLCGGCSDCSCGSCGICNCGSCGDSNEFSKQAQLKKAWF